MRKKTLRIGACAALLVGALCAQDISGNWQGTVKAGNLELRAILRVSRSVSGGWDATLSSIDQSPDWGAGLPVDSLTFDGSSVRFKIDALHGSYDGKLNADGSTIAGTWTQGLTQPLELRRATPETAWKDPSPHTVQFVEVDKGVQLEVLDWGGLGRPLVMLSGLGNTAHVFDKFALKLAGTYHVYGITRRGYGASSVPTSGYSADRLGDDVLAVLDSLKLSRPVLVGHSIAGEELSSIGSRHPEKVAGLVYLDAGYGYAYYDSSKGDLNLDLPDLQKKLAQLEPGKGPRDPKQLLPLIQDLLDTSLPAIQRDLRAMQEGLQQTSGAEIPVLASAPMPAVPQAILAGQQKYTKIPARVLAIFAIPHDRGPQGPSDPAERAKLEAREEITMGAQAKAFETGLPSARVVRIPHANHYVFVSNEAEVLREMNAFVSSLP
jgi:pimeloyl-ACP methyl ester carboxylesterase